MNKRVMNIATALAIAACLTLTASAQGRGGGMGQRGGQGGQGGEQRQDMQTIHALFGDHQKITRTVKLLERGVETVTESDDPKVQALIVEHVTAMYQRLASKQPIRQWDPLFAELFKYADQIKLELIKTPKGIKAVETSADDYVVKLIQAHAQGVSEFVREGMPAMHREHPLPHAMPTPKKFLGKGDGVATCPVTGEPVDKTISAILNGRQVWFCCANCRDAVLQSPERYLKPPRP